MVRMRRGVRAGGGEGAAGDEYGEVTVSEGGGRREGEDGAFRHTGGGRVGVM